MAESIREVAARCLSDATFARQVVEGSQYPEVKAAILKDLRSGEVSGYFNPQPEPPGRSRYIPDPTWWTKNWSSLPRPNLRQLAGP